MNNKKVIDLAALVRSRMVNGIARFNFGFFKKLPAHHKRITLSTVVTLARILLVPFIVGAMLYGRWGLAFFLFVGAATSDTVDGTLARWLDEKTFLGACLDPIADKLLILSCFFTLAFVSTPLFSIPLWFVLIVLCKEMLQIAGFTYLLVNKGYVEVQPTILGKLTTMVQMGFITWLFACYFFCWLPTKTYWVMLGLMLLLVCASFIQYASIGIRYLRG